MTTVLWVVAILVFLIVIHELGHFIAAKIFGVKVLEFGIGYPPQAFRFGKIGETEYTLNWIPFGGFVRLFGEDGSEREAGSLAGAARYKQAIILIAGVLANAVAAWLLFASALTLPHLAVVEAPIDGVPTHLIISDVLVGSPADAAGIKPGDEIIGMVDARTVGLGALTPESVVEYVKARGGQEISITYVRAAATSTAVVRPANAVVPSEAGKPALGIALTLVRYQSLSWSEALGSSLESTRYAFVTVAQGLWGILKSMLVGAPNLSGVVGPVGLFSVVSDASNNGLGNVLALAGFIAVNLAIINLLPIPALDGGRLLIVIVEGILRRDAPRMLVQAVNTVGVALIILLMLVVTYHDIARLIA